MMKNLFPVVSANDVFSADSMFDNFFQGFAPMAMMNSKMMSMPKVDIEDKGNEYELTADLPGVAKEDINLTYDDNVLTLSASHEESKDKQNENKQYLRKERMSSSFCRQFVVPDIEKDGIQAAFKDGVLTVEMPKMAVKPAEASQTIQIQ